MKLSEIRKRISKAKELMSEYVMLECLANSMVKAKKEHPEDLSFNEEYYENVVRTMGGVKKRMEELFK